MDPLSVTASIIAVLQLSGKVLAYLNDVKHASNERQKCAIEIGNLYSLIIQLRFRVEEGFSDTPWYTAIQALAVENGPLDQFKQALEQLQDKLTGGSKISKLSDALMWKFKKEEIAAILNRMERLKSLVEIALQMDHFKLSKAIQEYGEIIHNDTQAIKDDTSFIRHEAQHNKLLTWLSHIDFAAKQSDIIGRRQEGTGQWFLDATEFKKWLDQPKGILFCPGIPGAGKTMIAAIAIEHLLKTKTSTSIGIAYVYCNYKEQEEQSTTNMLAAILKQLVQARPAVMEPAERLHMQHASKGIRPSLDDIFGTLQSVIASLTTVYIVVDALDECQDSDGTRRGFLSKLQKLSDSADLRLMVTSRITSEIADELKTASKLEIRASDDDVRHFIAGQVYRLPKCVRQDSDLGRLVQDKITAAVDGMFLLARLHVDSFLDKRTIKAVKSTLERLSKGSDALDDAYREAINRIEGQLSEDFKRARQVLSWVTYAERPLTTNELCCALAIETDEPELDPENVPDIEDLVSVCAGLVVVDPESAVVRLVHYTTQEYFERIKNAWIPSAQIEMASACLTYLSFDVFKNGKCLNEPEYRARLRQHPFLEYAAKHWGQHVKPVESSVLRLACSFLSCGELVACTAQIALNLRPGFRYPPIYLETITGLQMAARSGLPNILKTLMLSEGQDAMLAPNEDGRRTEALLLYTASACGRLEIAKLVLEVGAKVNVELDKEFGNALQAASARGHQQIVELLLDIGADVNARGGHYGNALQAASARGLQQIVQLLLDRGVDVNARGGDYGNALQAASVNGHHQKVELLLYKSANVSARGGHYGNALQAASARGYRQIVELLLDIGADVNVRDGEHGNALQAASVEGHQQIVELLLDKGANVNARGGHFGNALQAASARGYRQIVELLLDKGADVNARGGDYGNALQGASARGYEKIVALLLDKGADVNARGGLWDNAVRAASAEGHQQIVELLLEKGADINVKGEIWGNVLRQL